MMSYLKEGKRAPGSEWLKERPHLLERLYEVTVKLFGALYPAAKRVSPRLIERVMIPVEEISKGYLFNCQMCGQCILHSTGMTCPMTCPKNLRNGPCGGVRADGHCEVLPELPCIWVQAWERSNRMGKYGHEIMLIQPPVDRQLQHSSSWINLAEGRDRQSPPGWQLAEKA